MLRYMSRATASVLGSGDDFVQRFKAAGWYLDDLVLTPVNHLTKPERELLCLGARSSLAERIALYQPQAIVSLLKSIHSIIEAAAREAGSTASLYSLPSQEWDNKAASPSHGRDRSAPPGRAVVGARSRRHPARFGTNMRAPC
jgi:hypothetical protein